MPKKQHATDKPIARVKGKLLAKIYHGRLVPAEHVKYLDIAALEKAKEAVIEVGNVEAAGRTVPLVAEVCEGRVVNLRPRHCAACTPAKRKGAVTASARRQAAKAALQKVRELGLSTLRLPLPVARLRGGGLFGVTITVIIDWEVCIVIEFDDGHLCYICTQTPSFCIN